MPRISDPGRIDEFIVRLESIPDDARPKWGTLDKAGVIEHLIFAVRGPMGQTDRKIPPMGNFLLRNIVGPLLINGLLPMPKNIPLKDTDGGAFNSREPGDLNDLRATLEDFCARRKEPGFAFAEHPAFGAIGPDGWDKLHYQHFNHHCRQFGV